MSGKISRARSSLGWMLALAALLMVMAACGSSVTIVEQGTPTGSTGAAGSTGAGSAPTATPNGGGGSHPNPTPTSGGGNGGSGSQPTPTPTNTPPSAPPSLFVQHATSTNSFGDYTILNNCACDGHADALLIVTPNWNPGGAGGVYDDHPLGVYYRGSTWAIFNEDGTHIPSGAAFNVWVLSQGSPFVQVASPANIGSDYTIIDRGGLNGNPAASLLVTANWNPPGSNGVYDPHPLGVFYIAYLGRWAVFNQDRARMPVGAAFNVLDVSTLASQGGLLWTGSPANSTSDYTVVDHSGLNGDDNALLFVTPNWNPGGATGVYEDHNLGVYYNGYAGKWAIFDQDGAPISSGAAFNLWAFGSRLRIIPPVIQPPVSALGN